MRVNFLWWLIVLSAQLRSGSATSLPKEVVAEVETSLRSLFGFKGRPKVDRSKIVIPQVMIDLYEKQVGSKFDTTSIKKPGLFTQSANTVRSYTHIESPVDSKFTTHHRFRLKFDVSIIPNTETLKAAEITLNRHMIHAISDNRTDSNHYLQRIMVIDIIRPGKRGKYEPITRLMDSKVIDVRKNTTISVDVLPAVERWLADPKSNHGIIINVRNVDRRKTKHVTKHLRLKRDAKDDWSQKQPLLFTYTDDGKNTQRSGKQMLEQRRRRAARNGRRDDKREPCRRHPMRVNFEHVGWNDWIVAPGHYDAFYCKGECNFPLAEHLNATNHGIVQSIINSVTPSVPKPCCIPTQLSSMSMLYTDVDGHITLKNYREMVVVGCGCR